MAGSWSLGRVWVKFPEGHPQHGLEVLMRRRLMREPTPDEVFEFLDDDAVAALPVAEARDYLTALTEHRIAQFARLLIRWNFAEPVYDDEGNETGDELPVPPTAAGVGKLDPETFTALWIAYDEATSTVAPPLPQRSESGERSEVESTLPQETLSTSPRTLDTL